MNVSWSSLQDTRESVTCALCGHARDCPLHGVPYSKPDDSVCQVCLPGRGCFVHIMPTALG